MPCPLDSSGRRAVLGAAAASAVGALLVLPQRASAQAQPGVSATEIRIGNTTSLSGPVSALGTIARAQAAFFKMINDQGGVAGRKITFIFYGDGFNPAQSTVYAKDPSDPGLADDPGIKGYKAFMAKWFPEGNPDDFYNAYGYMTAMVMTRVLQQCNGDFSRRSIMAQANNLKDLENPILLPGIRLNTSPTDHRPLKQMQMQRFDGRRWVRFGPIFEGSNV